MSGRRILVTGGSGFIGSSLVKALLLAGHRLRVLDDNSRGNARRLKEVAADIDFITGDIRDAEAVAAAAEGMDEVHHLAFVNGTEFFYTAPELVLDVGVRGMINVIDACRRHGIGTLAAGLELGGLSDPAENPDRRDRAARRARSAQPALFLRRRQAHQRDHGDQFRPQILRARADLPPAQRLRSRHGLRARDPAIRAAPAGAGGAAARRSAALSPSRAPARKPAASASSTISSPASW